MIRRICFFLLFIPVIGFSQEDSVELSEKYEIILRSSLDVQLKIDSLQNILEKRYQNFDAGNEVAKKEIKELKRNIFFLQEEANVGYKQVRSIEQMELSRYLIQKNKRDSVEQIRMDSIRDLSSYTSFVSYLKSHSILRERHIKRLTELEDLENKLIRNLNYEEALAGDLSQLSKKKIKSSLKTLKAYESLNAEKYQIYLSYIHFAREKCKDTKRLDMGEGIEKKGKDNYSRSKAIRNRASRENPNMYSLQKKKEANELTKESLGLIKKAYLTYLDEDKLYLSEQGDQIKSPVIFYNEFAILPYCRYSEKNPISLNIAVPDGIIFKIQLGVFSNPMLQDKFQGISPIEGEEMGDIDAVKYYAGIFSNFEDAEKALIDVHSSGFQEAYIVAFLDREKISVNRALQYQKSMEPEKGIIEYAVLDVENPIDDVITYRIQIGVYEEDIPLYVIDILKKNIGNKKIVQHKNKNGHIVYSIEKFNNFEDAQKVQNILVENHLSDIFIVAFEKGKRISLKEAIENQDNLVE